MTVLTQKPTKLQTKLRWGAHQRSHPVPFEPRKIDRYEYGWREVSRLNATAADGPVAVDYSATHCPIAEQAAYKEMIWLPHEVFLGEESDIDDFCDGIEKLRAGIGELAR